MTSRTDIAETLYALDESYRNVEWEFERLPDGWTNQSYKITSPGEPTVLRIANPSAHFLGVSRETEIAAIRIGEAAGLAPPLKAWQAPEGHSLTKFVEGKRWDSYDKVSNRQLDFLADVAMRLRQENFDKGTNLFTSTRKVFRTIHERGIEMPEGAAEFMTGFKDIQATFEGLTFKPVLCHNDINKVNVIEADQIYIIDWEYAGHGHPLMELARISTLYELTSAQENYFLSASRISGDNDLHLFNLLKEAVLISDVYWSILRLHIPPIEDAIATAINSDIKDMMRWLNRRGKEQESR